VFTSRREDPLDSSAIRTYSDQKHLASIVTDDHFHRTDNEVVYYKLIHQTTLKIGESIITSIHRQTSHARAVLNRRPGDVQDRDVVEVQTTVSVVQVKKERFRKVINLRACYARQWSLHRKWHFEINLRKRIDNGMRLQKADSHRLKTMASNSRIREPTLRAQSSERWDMLIAIMSSRDRRKVLSMAICHQDEEDE